MPETDQQAVKLILIEINNMEKIMFGKSRSDLEADITLERAVSMTLGLIGEKATKINPKFKAAHPEIEWRKIIALRNRIVHSYEDLDFDIIYDTVERKLPELKEQLEKLPGIEKQMLISGVKPKHDLLPKKPNRQGKGRRL